MVCHRLTTACFNMLNEFNDFSAPGCSRRGLPPGGTVGLLFVLETAWVFVYRFQGRIYMVGLTWVISAEFFVLLFAHKLCTWRNFSPWVACKFLTAPQIFRIWHLMCAVGCLNCFFGGPLLLLIYTPASLQSHGCFFLATEQTWDRAAGPELFLRDIPHVCFTARGWRRPVQKRFLLEMPFLFAKQFSLVQRDTNFQASWYMTYMWAPCLGPF